MVKLYRLLWSKVESKGHKVRFFILFEVGRKTQGLPNLVFGFFCLCVGGFRVCVGVGSCVFNCCTVYRFLLLV